jgi:hypothetical protein
LRLYRPYASGQYGYEPDVVSGNDQCIDYIDRAAAIDVCIRGDESGRIQSDVVLSDEQGIDDIDRTARVHITQLLCGKLHRTKTGKQYDTHEIKRHFFHTILNFSSKLRMDVKLLAVPEHYLSFYD